MSANSNFRQVANLAGQVNEVTAGHIGASSVDSGIVSTASVALPELDDVVVSETLVGTLNGTTAVSLITFGVAGSIIGLSVSSPDGSGSDNKCSVKVGTSGTSFDDLLTDVPLNSPVPVCAVASGALGTAGGAPVSFSAADELTVEADAADTSTVSVTVHYVEA